MVIFHSYVSLPEGTWIYLVIHQPPLIRTVSINNCSTVASESLSCSFSMTPVKGPLIYCHRKLANHGYHQILGMILRRTRSDITRSNSGNPQIVDKHQMWFEQIKNWNIETYWNRLKVLMGAAPWFSHQLPEHPSFAPWPPSTLFGNLGLLPMIQGVSRGRMHNNY